MSLQDGHHIHSLTTQDFVPNGAVAVVTSLQCVEWLRALVQHLWLFKVGERAPYRGMPLIILALDKGKTVVVVSLANICGCNTIFCEFGCFKRIIFFAILTSIARHR